MENNELQTMTKSVEDATTGYQQSVSRHREEKRALWEKIILLSSGILGFSVTMFSGDYLSTVSTLPLKIGWLLFLTNITSGLYALKKESDFEQAQSLANLLFVQDDIKITKPVKDEEKKKLVALMYLRTLRTVSPKRLPFSKLAKNYFDEKKYELESWKLINDPEKFYSYTYQRKLVIGINVFYFSFGLAMLALVFSVI